MIHQAKSSGVNFPNSQYLSSDLLINSFPTEIKFILSVSSLQKFRIAKELKCFCNVVECPYFLTIFPFLMTMSSVIKFFYESFYV